MCQNGTAQKLRDIMTTFDCKQKRKGYEEVCLNVISSEDFLIIEVVYPNTFFSFWMSKMRYKIATEKIVDVVLSLVMKHATIFPPQTSRIRSKYPRFREIDVPVLAS